MRFCWVWRLGIIFSLARLGTELPQYASKAQGLVNSATAKLAALGVGPEQIKQAAGSLNLGKLAGVIGALLSSVAGLASNFVFLLALLLFLSVETGGAGDRMASIAADRPRISEALGHFAWGTRQYLLVTTVFGAIVAVLDTVALALLGIPLAVTWGLLSFITNYIPNIGFILGVIPPALLGLLTGGPKLMVIVIVVYCVLNTVIQSVIQPRFIGDAVGLSVTVTFVVLFFWAWLLGPLGAILAIPITLLCKALLVDIDPQARVGRRAVAGLGEGARPGRTSAGEEAPSSPARPSCRPGRRHGRSDRRAVGPRGAGRAVGRTGAIGSSTGPARRYPVVDRPCSSRPSATQLLASARPATGKPRISPGTKTESRRSAGRSQLSSLTTQTRSYAVAWRAANLNSSCAASPSYSRSSGPSRYSRRSLWPPAICRRNTGATTSSKSSSSISPTASKPIVPGGMSNICLNTVSGPRVCSGWSSGGGRTSVVRPRSAVIVARPRHHRLIREG